MGLSLWGEPEGETLHCLPKGRAPAPCSTLLLHLLRAAGWAAIPRCVHPSLPAQHCPDLPSGPAAGNRQRPPGTTDSPGKNGEEEQGSWHGGCKVPEERQKEMLPSLLCGTEDFLHHGASNGACRHQTVMPRCANAAAARGQHRPSVPRGLQELPTLVAAPTLHGVCTPGLSCLKAGQEHNNIDGGFGHTAPGCHASLSAGLQPALLLALGLMFQLRKQLHKVNKHDPNGAAGSDLKDNPMQRQK